MSGKLKLEHFDPPSSLGAGAVIRAAEVPDGAMICVDDLSDEKVNWLWPGYIPRGALSLLDGDPGLGKSFITLDLVARVTRGWAMPPAGGKDGTAAPANVLVLNVEDDHARVVVPRLEAMGADLERVHFLEGISAGDDEIPITFPGHLGALEDFIAKEQIAFVIIDPLAAYLGGGGGLAQRLRSRACPDQAYRRKDPGRHTGRWSSQDQSQLLDSGEAPRGAGAARVDPK